MTMNKKQFSVIVFDLGNVLIPFNYNIFLKKLEDIEGGLGKKFYDLYKENYHVHQKFERWELSNSEFLSIVLGWLDNKIDEEYFCEIYSDIFSENKELTALLPILKEDFILVLLSNTNDIHRRYGWSRFDFLQHFDKLVLSHEVGAIKPEEMIYRAVTDFTKEQPEKHLFIDDVVEYAEGAKKLGWDALQFTGTKELIDQFKARGILS